MGVMMELNPSLELSEDDLLFGDGAAEGRNAMSGLGIQLEAARTSLQQAAFSRWGPGLGEIFSC